MLARSDPFRERTPLNVLPMTIRTRQTPASSSSIESGEPPAVARKIVLHVLLALLFAGLATTTSASAAYAAVDGPAVKVAERSTRAGTLTVEDRRDLRELGLMRPHAAVIVVRKLPRSSDGRERMKLRALAHAPQGFAGSGACDELIAEGEARAACRGHGGGPFGNVALRMLIETTLTEGPEGSLHLVIRNRSPLEAKGLFSWSSLVAADHLVLTYDLVPNADSSEWRVYTRIGVEMSSHEDSANTISETMLKVDAWLTRSLAT